MTNLLRQSVYRRLAGYEDVNDAQRLSVDPVMRAATGKSCWNRSYNGMKTIKERSAFVVMPHLQSLRSMNTLKKKGSCMMILNIC